MKQNKSSTQEEKQYSVPNLNRALDVIELLTEHTEGLTLTEVQEKLNYPKSSLFRIMSSLNDRNYLLKNDKTGTFSLSKKLLHIGLATLSETSLVEKALNYMRKLRNDTKETVLLGTLDGNEVVLLEQAIGTHPFTFRLSLGKRINLHASAPGKAILSYLPEEERETCLKQIEFEKFNDNTIIDPKQFREELYEVKKLGYALDRAEEYEGVHCVGAPIFNQHGLPIASLWVTAPSVRLSSESFEQVGSQVSQKAMEISKEFGFKKA
ncbi:IclR family transcriptional regulator [Aureibacter tunicatorum]|uniref:DNA-binding IclR family transcriptional regulator n=1 Tax=Aureibacter tunicatorum TaxID=866807 RepID=A0AAE3XR41_9BACT|nr:IclR family transcriptional regulator [Aureibacter tunicatorum]MDR6241607.1 DNA-binding IclR family transcriptional regulator [Aureibacter tunicatorum]BDD07170.1 IclR family transcriptional regulator [Aureibacter tunicatorum]